MLKLKRPLAYIGSILILVLAAVFLFDVIYGVIVLVGAVLMALAKLSVKNKKDAMLYGVAAVTAAVALGLYAAETSRERTILETYTGETVTVTARVTQSRDLDGACLVTAQAQKIDGSGAAGFEFTFFLNDEYMDTGDQFTAALTFSGQNPYKDSLSLQAELAEMHGIARGKHKLYAWAYTAQKSLEKTITQQLPRDAGSIAAAAVTGDTRLISGEVNTAVQRVGLTHILVVSGLHITLIVGLCYRLFDRFKLNRYIAFALLLGLVAACVLFYGWTPSVVRSCVMCLIVYAGRVLMRRTDAPTSLSLAAIVILVAQPSAVKDVSFLLSFGCCFALIVVYPPIERALHRRLSSGRIVPTVLRGVANALGLSLTISLITLPILILAGMPVSLVSPLANVLVVWLAPILTVCAFLMCIPFDVFTNVFGFVAGLCAKGIIAVAEWFGSFSFAAVSTGAPYLKVWIAFCAVLLIIYKVYRKDLKIQRWFLAMCMALVLLAGLFSRLAFTIDKPSVTLYNEDIVILQDSRRAIVVVDDINTKGVDYLVSYLNYRYVEDVAYVIITSDVGQAAERHIRQQFPGAIIAAAYETATDGILSQANVQYLQRMERFTLLTLEAGGMEIEINGSILLIAPDMPELEKDYDMIIRLDGKNGYIVHANAYTADTKVVLYINDDGSVKTVVE